MGCGQVRCDVAHRVLGTLPGRWSQRPAGGMEVQGEVRVRREVPAPKRCERPGADGPWSFWASPSGKRKIPDVLPWEPHSKSTRIQDGTKCLSVHKLLRRRVSDIRTRMFTTAFVTDGEG